jgi:excisionase family DNA binding protein
MGSKKDIEFEALIAPDGSIRYTHDAADESAVHALVERLDPGGRSETINVVEAAALLEVDRNTLYEALGRGEGPPARRIGRVYRLARASVLRWLSEGDASVRGRR